jgi:glycerophosphoryl diester phosphodiesterase
MKVIGHRGAPSIAPENTFAGFDLALEIGVDALETDVQRTKDGKLVLFHDARIERTTNGRGRLQHMAWYELRGLDAGSWFHRRYAGERIALLTAFLQKYGRRIPIELEVKQAGIEQEVVGAVIEHNLLERITFTSFDFSTASHIKDLAPQANVGFLTSSISEKTIARVRHAGITQFCPIARKVTKALVDKWRSQGLFIRAWGVKNIALMRQAISAGIDGMTVDFPDALLAELGRYGHAREVRQKLQSLRLERP